jgi:hypothetical protein
LVLFRESVSDQLKEYGFTDALRIYLGHSQIEIRFARNVFKLTSHPEEQAEFIATLRGLASTSSRLNPTLKPPIIATIMAKPPAAFCWHNES